ncbi:hypothetical protein niasHS_003888 [Heterodera schachtii]|uniref:FLYWCH-type domain-containing protein n=1 Tax=Heterodera schachtii TaxID=97005 RepID=A0ABD2K3H5_HETSC
MHQFQRYDPAQPRTVTSFKGNQKLIFEGYRYNIHHIVPAKGVKTWRCVCAKKLTCSRSWCKGRAETWDDDGQGISKGEHNHPAEHEVAELEYFKSQLILAAIASPNANLNELIDEAIGFMSEGVSFGSRESLKKSLTVARKAAENGGFKLKCYKSSDKPFKSLAYNNIVQPQQQQKQEQPLPGGTTEVPKKAMPCATPPKNGIKAKCHNPNMDNDDSNAHVMTLLSLAKQCRENRMQEKGPPLFGATSCSPPSCRAPSVASLSLLDSSGFHSGASLNCSTTCPSPSPIPNSSPSSTFLFAAVAAAAAAAALNSNKSNTNSTKRGGGMALIGQKRGTERTDAKLSDAAGGRIGTNSAEMPSNCGTNQTMGESKSRSNGTNNNNKNNNNQLHNAQIVQRKKARVNSIFDRLSTKAAEAATKASSSEETSKKERRDNTQFNVAETQTDNGTDEVKGNSANDHTNKGDNGWRVVRICCCGDRGKCTRGLKRKRSASPAEAGDFEENATTMAPPVEEHSPPPSASSSVENQPQQNGTMAEEENGGKEGIGGMAIPKTNTVGKEQGNCYE